jgi:hypothetical protein
MKTISWILLLSMILYSCSSTYTISHTQSDYLELNETLDEEEVLITLINDTVIVGENVRVELDSTSWFEPAYTAESTTTRTVPTWAVNHVEIRDGWKGFQMWWGVSTWIIGIPAAIIWYNSWKESDDYDEQGRGIALLAAMGIGSAVGLVVGIPFGIIGSQRGIPERYNLSAPKDSTDLSTDIILYFNDDKYYDENEPIPNIEVEPPILQPDGNYKINVSSLKWKKEVIIVTWPGKRIVLPKSEVKNSWKSGDKSYIIISPELYESKFSK